MSVKAKIIVHTDPQDAEADVQVVMYNWLPDVGWVQYYVSDYESRALVAANLISEIDAVYPDNEEVVEE